MIQQKLERLLAKRCTLLGVGPMSLNCIDATIELANEKNLPIMLIASRRQIDSEDFRGGYVNNWTTQQFAEYVIEQDKGGKIILVRDHGGPWQNPVENKLSLRLAMESAKSSYRADIDSGFQILHIDPSIDVYGHPAIDDVLDRIFELYDYCWGYAQSLNQKILFEIGTEEQSGSTNTQEELDYTLNAIQNFCKKNKLPMPLFVVIQTGTRVMETRNIGSFDSPLRVVDEIPAEIQIPKMVEICGRYGVFMKAHNTDYLSDDSLQWFPRLGIHAANVAPEFGVLETKAYLSLLNENGLSLFADEFLKISYDSGKWKKWMIKDTSATDRDKAIISGHYVFSNPKSTEIKAEVTEKLHAKGIDLNNYLKSKIKSAIYRYLYDFRLVRAL